MKLILKNIVKKLPIVWENTSVIPWLIKEVVLDISNDLRQWPYQYPIIFVAGIPKGGSTWLFSLLCRIPGYVPCPGIVRPLSLSVFENWNHDISQKMFDDIPKDKFTVIKLHTQPSYENIQLLKKNVGKVIVLVRDLRDVAVSRFNHEKVDKKSWCYKMYNTLPFEQAFWHNLSIVIKHYVPWMREWKIVEIITGKSFVHLVKYEDLLMFTVLKVYECLAFYNIEYPIPLAETIVYEEEKKTLRRNNLQKNLNTRMPTRERSTYSGKKRDWRDYFTKDQEAWFRKRAEGVMKRYGYTW